MKKSAYTIRIYVPNGDPEGVKIVDRMNWTGTAISFPRDQWVETKSRKQFDASGDVGIYVLVGYSQTDDELPTIYIGEGDGVRNRIDSHCKNKDFWTWGVVFLSTNRGLNKVHVQWLEQALINQAKIAARCHLDNANTPQEPTLSDAETADCEGFLNEILQILPLVGLRAFEKPKVIIQSPNEVSLAVQSNTYTDTIVVPAQKDGFEKVFLGENCWYAIRIGGGMINKLKWIAAYQAAPLSAITHYAEIARIEPYGEEGKYKIIFKTPAIAITPIPFADAAQGSTQSPRYTTYEKMMKAKKISELW